jgi:hypothetical protein
MTLSHLPRPSKKLVDGCTPPFKNMKVIGGQRPISLVGKKQILKPSPRFSWFILVLYHVISMIEEMIEMIYRNMRVYNPHNFYIEPLSK